jgi:hypothetical protein
VGTWDTGPFDNDDAADVLGGLQDLNDSLELAVAINNILLTPAELNEVISSRRANESVAAAALVAILANPSAFPALPSAAAWARECNLAPPEDLQSRARSTLVRVLTAASNEWYQLWAEASLIDEVAADLSLYLDAIS